MNATLQIVADRAGVSKPTASHILSPTSRRAGLFNPQTRERVERVARELGYRPNTAARAITRKRFDTVSLVLGNSRAWSSLLSEKLLEAASQALAQHGLRLNVAYISDEKLTDPGFVPKVLSELCSDGLLINYNAGVPKRLEELVARNRIPSVWINSKHAANCVYPDEQAAACDATRRLLALGHRRIVFSLFVGFDHFSAVDRFAGYKQAMTEAGLEPRLIHYQDVAPRQVLPQLVPMLTAPDAPTAVIGYNPEVPRTYYHAAQQAGLRVPQDLSLIAFCEEPLHEIDITFATVLIPEQAMGIAAVEGLLKLIVDPTLKLKPLALPVGFVEGETMGGVKK
jgi:LacI family transcriptional regulator